MNELERLREKVREAKKHKYDGFESGEVPACLLELSDARLALAKAEIETLADRLKKEVDEGPGDEEVCDLLRALIARVWGKEN